MPGTMYLLNVLVKNCKQQSGYNRQKRLSKDQIVMENKANQALKTLLKY